MKLRNELLIVAGIVLNSRVSAAIEGIDDNSFRFGSDHEAYVMYIKLANSEKGEVRYQLLSAEAFVGP